jgi:hypothetical protein
MLTGCLLYFGAVEAGRCFDCLLPSFVDARRGWYHCQLFEVTKL